MGNEERRTPSLEAPSLRWRRKKAGPARPESVEPIESEPIESEPLQPVEPVEPLERAQPPAAPAEDSTAELRAQIAAAINAARSTTSTTASTTASDSHTPVDSTGEAGPQEADAGGRPRSTGGAATAGPQDAETGVPAGAPAGGAGGTPSPPAPARRTLSERLASLGPLGIRTTLIVTGGIVSATLVVLTLIALNACASIRGAETCGRTGLPILTGILALAVVLGAVLLRLAGHREDAGLISFLAVAIVAVVTAVFLLDALEGVASAIVLPPLTIGAFWLAHKVATTKVDLD
jgi:hypothetical protein